MNTQTENLIHVVIKPTVGVSNLSGFYNAAVSEQDAIARLMDFPALSVIELDGASTPENRVYVVQQRHCTPRKEWFHTIGYAIVSTVDMTVADSLRDTRRMARMKHDALNKILNRRGLIPM